MMNIWQCTVFLTDLPVWRTDGQICNVEDVLQ